VQKKNKQTDETSLLLQRRNWEERGANVIWGWFLKNPSRFSGC